MPRTSKQDMIEKLEAKVNEMMIENLALQRENIRLKGRLDVLREVVVTLDAKDEK